MTSAIPRMGVKISKSSGTSEEQQMPLHKIVDRTIVWATVGSILRTPLELVWVCDCDESDELARLRVGVAGWL